MSDVSILPEKSALSLGLRLAALREEKGIPLEQAAHETRMMVQRLREMESDDLSHFVHPSYARMFLMDYARYLGLPLDEIRHLLPAQGACGGEGYQYLQDEGPLAVRRSRPILRRSPKLGRVVRVTAACMLGLLVVFGGIEATIVLRKIDRLGLSKVAQSDRAAILSQPAKAAPAASAETEPTPPIFPVENSMATPPPTDAEASLFVGGSVDHGNAVQ